MPSDLLAHLVGSWTLTGRRGQVDLRQEVRAHWAIQDRYVQMHFLEVGPIPEGKTRYEAIYLLGYDPASGEYELHLFDSFGSAYSRVVGIGTRCDDSIEFLFDYPAGQFTNRFTWHGATGEWDMLLREREGSGGWKVWATKVLRRV